MAEKLTTIMLVWQLVMGCVMAMAQFEGVIVDGCCACRAIIMQLQFEFRAVLLLLAQNGRSLRLNRQGRFSLKMAMECISPVSIASDHNIMKPSSAVSYEEEIWNPAYAGKISAELIRIWKDKFQKTQLYPYYEVIINLSLAKTVKATPGCS